MEALLWLRSLLDDQRTNTMTTSTSANFSEEQRDMQNRICSPNLLIGITKLICTHEEHSFKQQGCSVLATLAWSNPCTSALIASTQGLLDVIASVLWSTHPDLRLAQEQATLVMGNCSANSKFAAETFAKHTGEHSFLEEDPP